MDVPDFIVPDVLCAPRTYAGSRGRVVQSWSGLWYSCGRAWAPSQARQTKHGRTVVDRGHRPKQRLFRQVSPTAGYVFTSRSPSACRSPGFAPCVCLHFLVLNGFIDGYLARCLYLRIPCVTRGVWTYRRGARFHCVYGRALPGVCSRFVQDGKLQGPLGRYLEAMKVSWCTVGTRSSGRWTSGSR